ncbi:MAG: rod shape-determining protein [Betaproteobacteria bacterium]|nr:rod shape-determining protein [Betaproteobacteria bacterium]
MLANFFKQYLYIQLSPQKLTVRDPVKRTEISEIPEIAIRRVPGKPAVVVAVGAAARGAAGGPSVEVLNPFAHPRSLFSDFIVAEMVLKAFVERARGKSISSLLRPVIVMHPLGEPEGGLTQVELQAMRELAIGAGASSVYFCILPKPLTDEQVLQFLRDGFLDQ